MASKELTIYCHCGHYDLADEQVKADVLRGLTGGDGEFVAVTDLCGLCANKDPRLKEWTQSEHIRIFACYPRAVKWLFAAGDAPLPNEGVEYFNFRTGDTGELAAITSSEPNDAATAEPVEFEKGDWTPWFPAIDYDRCNNCKQCLNFCLFGVYQLGDDDKIEVALPANCKTNCPACARVCPRAAIIFSKYTDGPINGDVVDEDALKQHKEKARLEILLKGDIRERLRNRGPRKRFSGEDSQPQAGSFEQLQKELDIPASVLESLSPTEIVGIKKRAANRDKSNTNTNSSTAGRGERTTDE